MNINKIIYTDIYVDKEKMSETNKPISYQQLRKQQQEEYNAFPKEFGFGEKQIAEGLVRLGFNPGDTDKVVGIGGGGFIRCTDAASFKEMLVRHHRELTEAMKDEEFAYTAFHTELMAHEYSWTGDASDTINALGLTIEEIENNPTLKRALKRAAKDVNKSDCFRIPKKEK